MSIDSFCREDSFTGILPNRAKYLRLNVDVNGENARKKSKPFPDRVSVLNF